MRRFRGSYGAWRGKAKSIGGLRPEVDWEISADLLVALVTVVPTTLAVVVAFLVNLRSVRQEVATPLRESIQRLEDKVDHLAGGLIEIRERLARLEAKSVAAGARSGCQARNPGGLGRIRLINLIEGSPGGNPGASRQPEGSDGRTEPEAIASP